MILKTFNSFRDAHFINENMQAAKAYLRRKALDYLKGKNPKMEPIDINKIDDILADKNPESAKIRSIAQKIKDASDNNKDFLKIKEMLLSANKPALGFLFTKFKFEDKLPDEDLKILLDKIIDLSQYINKLPMPLDKYAQISPNSEDARPASERLSDDLKELSEIRATDRFVKRLPGQFVAGERAPDKGDTIPSMKDAYRDAPEVIKEKIKGIAVEFENLGAVDGKVDPQINRGLQDQFFDIIKRYRSLNEIINAARRHIKGANLENEVAYLEKIAMVNKKYGDINGCEVLSFEDGVLITHVKSFQANRVLNSDTSHCIADSLYRWQSYVSGENIFNNQYYIRNFNKTPDDNYYVIGITIEPRGNVLYAHLKNNASCSSSIRDYINNTLKLDFKSILKPMTKIQIEEKKKRDSANKNIVKQNLSIDQIKEYLNYGADPNAENGRPLNNAVSQGNLEKVKYLVEQGANPAIGNPLDSLRENRSETSREITKILIMNGASISAEVFDSFIDDIKTLEEILDSGKFDVDQKSGLALRRAALIGTPDHYTSDLSEEESYLVAKKAMSLLFKYGADVSQRGWYVLKSLAENGKFELMKFVIEEAKKQNKWPDAKEWARIIWFAMNNDTEDEKKDQMVKWLKNTAISA